MSDTETKRVSQMRWTMSFLVCEGRTVATKLSIDFRRGVESDD